MGAPPSLTLLFVLRSFFRQLLVTAAGRSDIANDAITRLPAVRFPDAASFLVTGASDHRPLTLFWWIVRVSSATDVDYKTVVVRFFHGDEPPPRQART
jgi:hypothetical protein